MEVLLQFDCNNMSTLKRLSSVSLFPPTLLTVSFPSPPLTERIKKNPHIPSSCDSAGHTSWFGRVEVIKNDKETCRVLFIKELHLAPYQNQPVHRENRGGKWLRSPPAPIQTPKCWSTPPLPSHPTHPPTRPSDYTAPPPPPTPHIQTHTHRRAHTLRGAN